MSSNCIEINNIMQEVRDWLTMLSSTKEESITDFLEYKMKKHLHKIKFIQFTKKKEAMETGADFDLMFCFNKETWVFRIQAKKIKKGVNRGKFDYKKGRQINLLISSSKSIGAIPLYSFYYLSTETNVCKNNKKNDPVSLMGALKIKSRMSLVNKDWSKGDKLFKESMPLSCLFCCDKIDEITGLGNFLNHYSGSNNPFDEETINQGRHLRADYPKFIYDLMELDESGKIPASLEEFSKNTNAIVFIDCRKKQFNSYDS